MKLNLGCGSVILKDFVNVDKFDFYKPNIVHDLEVFPYPFQDNSVDEIILSHVLEHIGQIPDVFNEIIKELYRICRNGSLINITVPHPRHDDFISDPTHVRPITLRSLSMYDQKLNKIWEEKNASNTPLGLIHNVNFQILSVNYVLDQRYQKLLNEKKIKENDLKEYSEKYNNVIKEINLKWKVIK
jgi:ubiquinone/menaquinone biosynthesis C-methylase UbiE